ncbi:MULTISPECIES: hypothetical protein [unclassified Brenneria]|uniref:hypothetical protein n=1 Tax=unclassified Brenneria TaxID=2634434 RepID=UPI0029C1F788|nr:MULTISPECIES: hypothetical protein [unclassified Brenneria]MDX5630256.1 hypothetical protein [Brenneria sp. L3-3Z]MDX5697401.1 hypothetical protein [Brenneria sp. L4-2C]MEE3660916.1 hypothetical protein [Brenneria sp. g21c3]
MFAKLKELFNPVKQKEETENDESIQKIEQELSDLELRLSQNPADSAIQKQLMIKYNQAIQAFSNSTRHRNKVDDVFVKIDELRNTIRKNI